MTKESYFLTGTVTWQDGHDSIRAKLFQNLLTLADETVTHYRGDLYHDAVWIDREVHGPCTFYFAVRSAGTSISFSKDDVTKMANDRLYEVTLTDDDGRGFWRVHIYEVGR